ncbi:MAG TPA: hypothetical protein EYN67_13870 [Flavobacteriales bacterium]|nr:hypothetical protein [Flavobacteriales bacterium]
MPKKLQPIDYTSRDFDSIRRDLENYAKRYYPDTYKDFNKASFGSLMLDTVSYVGDILSFYVDYQANESFLETAVEYDNVLRLARQMGFKLNRNPSSYGILTFYIQVPADPNSLGPDLTYAPTLAQGSVFSSLGGGSYTLLEDVNFAVLTNQVVPKDIDNSTNDVLNYVVRAQGRAVSGRTNFKEVEVFAFERFLKVNLNAQNITDVISVRDLEGHEYVQVDNLSQNVIYKAIRNTDTSTAGAVRNIMKAVPVARRFTVESADTTTYLQFGYGSDSELLSDSVVDPTNLVLDLNGRTYITDAEFDPTKLISSDKFGIAPSNTTLRIAYRTNEINDVNASVATITNVSSPNFKFRSQGGLSTTQRNIVVGSLEVTNDEPFTGDISLPSSEEVKQRVFGFYAAQNRAVTIQDYQAICYGMPGKFGAIKRVAVSRDFDELRRNINIYVISESTSNKLIAANQVLKNNLKTWLLQYKIINDTVDILDAIIVNFGINYVVVTDTNVNRFTVLNKAKSAIAKYLSKNQYDIGESIAITDFYKVLQKVDGIVDVVDVEIVNKSGNAYSDMSYNFAANLSADGRRIPAPQNVIFELKFPNVDIKGSVT